MIWTGIVLPEVSATVSLFLIQGLMLIKDQTPSFSLCLLSLSCFFFSLSLSLSHPPLIEAVFKRKEREGNEKMWGGSCGEWRSDAQVYWVGRTGGSAVQEVQMQIKKFSREGNEEIDWQADFCILPLELIFFSSLSSSSPRWPMIQWSFLSPGAHSLEMLRKRMREKRREVREQQCLLSSLFVRLLVAQWD